jgi:hypothetical protein
MEKGRKVGKADRRKGTEEAVGRAGIGIQEISSWLILNRE